MKKDVLLINDIAGYGKVALSVMIPTVSAMGISVHNLPTAIVSNTLDYGKFNILDTTDYMRSTLKVWKELDFKFDAVSTGFIVNMEQAKLIRDFCREQSDKGVKILCDPIMGDEGKLYPGIENEAVENMRELIKTADYILPNYTEAVFLTDSEYKEEPTDSDIRALIEKLRELGAKSVIITSAKINGIHMVSCYDAVRNRYFNIPYVNIPVRFPGTGDIFSSVVLGSIVKGMDMESGVAKAIYAVRTMIENNIDNEDKFKGIEIESSLEVLNQ